MVQLSEVKLMKLLNLHPIIGLQKEAVRIITFSQYHEHISPIFEDLNIMKFLDVISYLNCLYDQISFKYATLCLP